MCRPAGGRGAEIQFAAAFAVMVAGNADGIDVERQVDCPHEVGGEGEGAVHQRDQGQRFAAVVFGDLPAEPGDVPGDFAGGAENFHDGAFLS